jgi:hypothetical protein
MTTTIEGAKTGAVVVAAVREEPAAVPVVECPRALSDDDAYCPNSASHAGSPMFGCCQRQYVQAVGGDAFLRARLDSCEARRVPVRTRVRGPERPYGDHIYVLEAHGA